MRPLMVCLLRGQVDLLTSDVDWMCRSQTPTAHHVTGRSSKWQVPPTAYKYRPETTYPHPLWTSQIEATQDDPRSFRDMRAGDDGEFDDFTGRCLFNPRSLLGLIDHSQPTFGTYSLAQDPAVAAVSLCP